MKICKKHGIEKVPYTGRIRNRNICVQCQSEYSRRWYNKKKEKEFYEIIYPHSNTTTAQ